MPGVQKLLDGKIGTYLRTHIDLTKANKTQELYPDYSSIKAIKIPEWHRHGVGEIRKSN